MMPRPTQLTASVLLVAILAGCGASSTPSRTASAATANSLTAEAAGKDTQAAKLIASYQAVRGQTAAMLKKRAELIDKIGETDSDRAAAFLGAELDRVDAEGEASQDKLVPAIVSALSELDEDVLVAKNFTEAGEPIYDGTEAKRKKRRFNVWDIIRKHFKAKKKRKSSGGGGGTPPAPPAPPAL